MVRPSPTISATLLDVGTRRKGNDGNTWKVAEDKHGRQFWKKMTCVPKKTTEKRRTIRKKTEKRKTEKPKRKTTIKRKTQKPKKKSTLKTDKPKRKTYTRATRPSPSLSATLFNVGDRRLGNDGNIWKIIKTSNGTQRWQKM